MHDSWTQAFEIRATDVGAQDRLTVPALCRYLEEAAGQHATANGVSIEDLGRDNRTWVLGRLEMEIDELPGLSKRVEVTTWPARHRSFFVVRDFCAIDAASGEELVRATSTWFVIDRERRRAVRVPQMVRDLPTPDRPRALEETWSKLPRPERVDLSRSVAIGEDDLDVNEHVNHVRYLDWALATMDADFVSSRRLAELQIDFLAELTAEDEVVAEAALQPDGSTVLFRIASAAGFEAARVRSRWLAI